MAKQPVWLWIPKFGEQVLIDPDHALAAATRELPAQPDHSEDVAGDEWVDVVPSASASDGERA